MPSPNVVSIPTNDTKKILKFSENNFSTPRAYRYYGGFYSPEWHSHESDKSEDSVYFREVTLAFSWFNLGKPQPLEKVKCALAFISIKDHFSKKVGRELASSRLKDGPNFTFSIPETRNRSLLNLAVDSLIKKHGKPGTPRLFKEALEEMMFCSYYIKREVTGEFEEEVRASILGRKPNLIPQEYNLALDQSLATHFKILGFE